MKKTKKYFRDKVNISLASAVSSLFDIVEQYGKNPEGKRKRKSLRIPKPESFWSHFITDFHFYDGKLFANVYWQGSDTDGDDVIQILPGKFTYRIPHEGYDDGYRYRTVHSDIIITSYELYNTIKRLVNSL